MMRLVLRRLVWPAIFVVLGGFLSPVLLCGRGAITTEQEASSCCRAMSYACHKSDGGGPCCKHKMTSPAPVAVVTAARGLSCPQPVLLAVLLPSLANFSALPGLSYVSFPLIGGHSPPGNVPLFVLHSSLLI